MLTKVFQSGNSQAVRLPKEFRFHESEIEIFKRGEEIILRKKAKNLAQAFDLLSKMPKDVFQDSRQDEAPQERDFF